MAIRVSLDHKHQSLKSLCDTCSRGPKGELKRDGAQEKPYKNTGKTSLEKERKIGKKFMRESRNCDTFKLFVSVFYWVVTVI